MTLPIGFDREGQPIAVSLERSKLQETAGKTFREAWDFHLAAIRAQSQMEYWRDEMLKHQDERDALIGVLKELRITQQEAIGWVLGQPEPPEHMAPIETNAERRKAREEEARREKAKQNRLADEPEPVSEVIDKDF